ncbi:MAG: aldo/keto reductase [Bacteroidia bacterium]|jgi:aryl-alcohol dehydrogenase-like predicted oxidoreductase|nr:aldo/keto reductase [Bacteroidia bacterium]
MITTAKTFKIGGDLEVNRMGFGTMRATTGEGVWGDPKDKLSVINIIRKAVEMGVNFIDTADAYGPGNSELIVAEALKPYRNIVVATKGGSVKYAPGKIYANGKADYLKKALEDSLKRLGKETIDLYFLHRPDQEVPIEESVGALAEMQQQGKIKHIGISNVDIELTKRAMTVANIAAVQHSLNFDDRRNEALAKFTVENNMAFVAYYPVSVGNFSPQLLKLASEKGITPAQYSLAWLLNFQPNIIPIPGTSSEKHLWENMQSLNIRL